MCASSLPSHSHPCSISLSHRTETAPHVSNQILLSCVFIQKDLENELDMIIWAVHHDHMSHGVA